MRSKSVSFLLGTVSLLLFAFHTSATVYYVNATNPAPSVPFTTWATAATNIQDAVNLTSSGDTVLVTNGVYAFGGLPMAGTLTNRIALTNAITVQSVNGPWVTTILGAGATNGATAMRCAWLTNGASLIGFTLQNGATLNSGDAVSLESGGGVWCASSNALVENCVIFSNTAYSSGAGIYQGTVIGSLICSNGLQNLSGGASGKSVLENCTIVGNASYGVASPMSMTNCIVYFNNPVNCVVSGSAFSHCCTTPALAGSGNFTNAPQLMSDGAHLATNSPCIGAGVIIGSETDIFGLSWSNPPSIGCSEWYPAPVIVAQPSTQFPVTGGLLIGVSVSGQPPFTCWWTQNGQPVQNNSHYSSANTTALLINNVNLSDAGAYQVVVSNSFGMATSAVSQVFVHCVAGGGVAVPPYSDWTTAATNIQDAVNVCQSGDIVLVTNGLYAFGGLAMAGNLTNRVALVQPIMVQSVNGPSVTTIQGGNVTNGAPASRCAWLTNGAALVGFTLEGGRVIGGLTTAQESGPGVWCASSNAIVANCIICSNITPYYGGGVYLGTLRNCAIFGNNAQLGGGTYYSYLINCTVTANFASVQYGGSDLGYFTNCIIYNNAAGNIYNSASGQVSYCCTYPLPSGGVGNFTNLPLVFVDNVHLLTNSPCIGAGINLGSATDIDGRPWASPPSIGCSEAPIVPVASQPVVQLTANPVGFTVTAAFTGPGPLNYWWLKDGALLPDNGQFSSTQTSSLMVAGTLSSDAGGYQLVVSNAFGVVTSAVVQVAIHCVDANGTNPVPPYLTWATAATNIQDAITAAAAGDVVLVTNGLYASGGISMDGVITNRVSVNKAMLVQSVNGPAATVIQGAWDPVSTNGPGAVRCAWLTTNAIMSGFTLRGGATRSYSFTGGQAINGGGAWGPLQLTTPLATVANCVIVSNAAGGSGGGAAQLTLNSCTIATNIALGNGSQGGSGGGASACSLNNCIVTANVAIGSSLSSGGGVNSCSSRNCAIIGNSAIDIGGGASGGSLTNCTVAGNQVGNGSIGYGGGVGNCTLINSIVYLNKTTSPTYSSYSNNYSSTFNYCCTAPAVAGTGNISSNPQLLPDDIHISTSSPCIGAGNASSTSGVDLDGQPWNNPPSIGCNEWQPVPLIAAQPAFQVGLPAHGLTCAVSVSGLAPLVCYWTLNGNPIQNDGRHSNSSTASLSVNLLDPADAGPYQVVVSNSFGMVTSQVAQLVIHAVNVAGVSPVAPYSTWATAATTIQDAINAASAGDIVLVTNGLYSTGGMVMAGNLTNRVALDKPVTVVSVNGFQSTVIQGAWDPAGTTGPGAVRCAYIGDGALLNGFTLQNGATRSTGDSSSGGPLESGGGVLCNSVNGVAINCVLTNNSAVYGGGMAYGTLNNSLICVNQANDGGGTYYGILNNCTVVENYGTSQGGGVYYSTVRNSVVVDNYFQSFLQPNNYYVPGQSQISYSCTSPLPPLGLGNINADPIYLDLFHISSLSPCRGAGSPLYSSGTDLDGEVWTNPPSMGCDEVIPANLTGPLTLNISPFATNLLVNRFDSLWGRYSGRASYLAWSFGDGQAITNADGTVAHQWINPGDYTVTFTAYNNDNPLGVSTNVIVYVQPLAIPQLQSAVLLSNGFQFQFAGQTNANYTIQYTTNLISPVTWQTLGAIYYNNQSTVQVTDASVTNSSRFYRVSVQ